MKMQKMKLKKRISLLLTLIMLITMIPAMAFAEDPVVTDATDLDVFMNIDPTLGIDTTEFKGLVEDKLDELNNMYKVENDTRSYRVKTSSATIDPTDITKWEVYSHYDTVWYSNSEAWYQNYNDGEGIPSTWYYYPVTDQFTTDVTTANQKTSIETMLDDKADPGNGTGTHWGNTAGLDSHIYAYKQSNKMPAMQFYGYGTSNWADFLYYPASATSKKSVDFDVDASNVLPHSLKYAGFLINAGTTGDGSSKTMDGYVILFQYGPPNGTSPSTYLMGIYLYKLTNVNVDDLHAHGLKGISANTTPGYSEVASITNSTTLSSLFFSKSHISLDITSTGLKATLQKIDNATGELTGAVSYLFGSADTYQELDSTGFGGFGPYVDYGVTGHTCQNTSSYRYSNLEMSFAETLSGSSALESYQFADYLHNSEQKFYVNLTAPEKSYSIYENANDTDLAFVNMLAESETILITDEHEGTYLENTLGDNAKDVNDVDNSVVEPLLSPGASDTEVLAAKVAWLIYSSIYDPDQSTVDPPDTVATAALLLLDGPGTSGSSWGSAKQVNQIKKELMPGDELKVYLNPDNSQNAEELTAAYTLERPNGTTGPLTTYTDDANNDKLYFKVPKTDATGDYKVTLTYNTGGDITSVIPAIANYSILTDSISPTASVSLSGTAANLTFENTAGTDVTTTYTSQLDSYALYIDTSSAKPTVDESDYIPVSGTSASVNVATAAQNQGLTLEADTNYYLHVLLKDEAGNVGHTAQSFIFDAPTVAFTNPATNTYTAESPYEGTSVTFSLTPRTNEVASYKIGTGASEPTYSTPVSAEEQSSVVYTLPVGIYRLWIAATDTEGNESAPISIYVDNRKMQQLNGTDNYTFEAGVDDGAVLDYTSSSSPALEDGESLGAITYKDTFDPSNAILVTNGAIKVNRYVGTATITVTAAETSTHRQATDEITVRVVRPFTVSLTSYYTDTGITLILGYADEGNFGVGSTRELKYRKSGTSEWTTVPTSDWNWNAEYTIAFSGLDAEAEYEVMLSGQNARTPATTSTETLKFSTSKASATDIGTCTITLKNTESGDYYNVSIQSGGTVWDSGIATGNGSDVPYTFDNLPDGYYNIVVVHEDPSGNDDETLSHMVKIKGGAQEEPVTTIVFEFIGSRSARFRTEGDKSPAIAVDGLNDLLDPAGNTDDAAGMTVADKDVVDAGGKILIELVSKGLDESEVLPENMAKLNEIKGGQTLAMLVDLSLFKTVWELNDTKGKQHPMTSTSKRLTVAIPLSNIKGSNVKVYRVHGEAAQLIPEAKLDTDGVTYVWANDYQLGDSTTLTKGDAVGDAEYAVLSDGYAVLYVNKFSTYAIGYTPSTSSGSRTPKTQTVSVGDSDHGKVSSDSTGKKEGSTVTITVTPDDGYVLSKLSVRDADGNTITYTEKSDGKYQFTMPSSAVTIKAEFEKEQAKPADPNETGVAKWLITEDHIRYMVGDDNGYFNPANNMTRAEAAQMFYNLLLDKDIDVTASFSDVPEGAWYKKAVETLATLGVVTGYDGEYKANKYITRAEFTAIAMRFAVIAGGEAKFSDVADTDWAYQYIMSAAGYSWITGYADGTYKPQALITRAEVVNIVNNMLGRTADKDFIDNNRDKLKIFPDVTKSSYWAYYSIVEATNGHEYEALNGNEAWTEIE